MEEREKIAQVLADASSTLLKVASERDEALQRNAELEAKLAQASTRLEAEKLAAEMHEKGLATDQEFGELVADIEKAASEGELPVVQKAVKLAAPNMGGQFHINHDEARGTGSTDFERFIVGEVG
jgi:hypothetical protein